MVAQQVRASDWTGRNGQQWVENQDRLDRMLAPFGDATIAAAALMAGEQVLDVGCGAGDSSLRIAELVGCHGRVLGVDISEALIARARERGVAAGSGAVFQLADATIAPLPDAAFDCLFSRFGVMFFDDPVSAFIHMRGALKSDGRLAFTCWRTAAENDWVVLQLDAIRSIVPPDDPVLPDAPGPFSFGTADRIARILTAAGFTDIRIAPFDHAIIFGADVVDAVRHASEVGPLERALRSCPEATRARAVEAVGDAFARRMTPQGVLLAGAAWTVTALR